MFSEKDLKDKVKVSKVDVNVILNYRKMLSIFTIFMMGLLIFVYLKLHLISEFLPYFISLIIIYFIMFKIPYWLMLLKIKKLQRQVYYDFPLWVSSLEVLIISNTVVNTLKQSIPTCPASILPDLKRLVLQLEKDPTNKQYYKEFLSQYDIADIKEMMMDLYQFNFLNKDLMIQEFKSLNTRLNKMEQASRKQKQTQQIFLLGALNSIPLFLLGCYILLIANMLSSILMGSL